MAAAGRRHPPLRMSIEGWFGAMLHNDVIRFVLAALVTWRLTHLFVAEDGPADIVVRLRRLMGDSVAGRAMDCFYCLSVWIAAPLTLVVTRSWDALLVWPALSAAACLFERIGGSDTSPVQHEHLEL
jgi:hypothetical protein